MTPSLTEKRLTVVVGNYGSGKTELSLALALSLRAQGLDTALVDLDIVNPYFRSAERRDELERAGVRVLAPTFALSTVDIPALPAQIQSVFDTPRERVVFDVGGDDTGAAALGRYAAYFAAEPPEVLFVVNACRPLSRTAEDILDLMARIRARARLAPTALVNNTNLGGATALADILRGQQVTEEVARRAGLPVAAVCALPHLAGQLPPALRAIALPMRRRMLPAWMEDA